MRIRYMVAVALLVAVLWSIAAAVVVVARGRNISKCPFCRSSRIRQSKSRAKDRVLHYIYVRPYRCEACLKRFYALKRRHAEKSMRAGAG